MGRFEILVPHSYELSMRILESKTMCATYGRPIAGIRYDRTNFVADKHPDEPASHHPDTIR